MLGPALLRHLDEQLGSARRLLDHVLRQGQAIRGQRVDEVLDCIGHIQGEMERRGRMERERTALLTQAGAALGLPAHAVTLEQLQTLLPPADAQAAHRKSAELRGLLSEISREHTLNRALMKQELAFLDHLTRMVGGAEAPAYRPPSESRFGAPAMARPTVPSNLRALDLQA